MAACQRRDSRRTEAAGRAGRVDAGVMQGLVGVDVADSRHDTLVQQHGLHRGPGMAGEALAQCRSREPLAKRFGPEPAKERVGGARLRAGQPDPAEPPGVVVVQAGGLVELEDGPGGRIRHRLQHAGSRVAPGDHGCLRHGDDELAGHLRVDEQAAGVIERQDQDFAAAAGPADPVPSDAVAGDLRRPSHHLGVEDLHGHDAPAREDGGQPAAQRFHLGQLRHRLRAVHESAGSRLFGMPRALQFASRLRVRATDQRLASSRRRGTRIR